MVKVGRGDWRLEKVDDQVNPFAELLEILEECTGGKEMQVRELLWHVKHSEQDLWKKLTVKGITNCSEKKLMMVEEELKEYFDVSPDWRFIAPKGAIEKEYAKPIRLNESAHGATLRDTIQAMRTALEAARKGATGKKATGGEMFCAFGPRAGASPEKCAARVLAQRDQMGYQQMLPARSRLPTFQRGDELLTAYRENNVLVVCGSTGCGKTTQLPQMLLEELAEAGGGRILCTQPRRISATSVAERVATERGEAIGETVGYQIRFECKAGPETSLLYCTVGILLRHLTSNATLDGVSLVVVDEVHERDVHTDFALLILRDLVNGPRPDLKIVLMSATIDASSFIDYFRLGGDGQESQLKVGYVEIPGKTNYPIEEMFAEDILRDMLPNYMPAGPPPVKGFQAGDNGMRNAWASSPGAVAKRLPGEPDHVCRGISNMLRRPLNKVDVQLIGQVVSHITSREGEGSVLIFVPGWQEIADVVKELEKLSRSAKEKWHLYPLHSMVPPNEQRRIFHTLPAGERKIIISTNIAETSITVEDVVFVVDAGLIKGTLYTPQTNIASLECQMVSRSNVQQRRGRAGRCRPGKFYKLYSRLEWEENMTDSLPPEMQRTPVEELCLQVKSLRLPGSIDEVLGKALAPPAALAVSHAISLLRGLGALDQDEELTTLGWKLSAMPLHPSLGKMLLLGSLFGCVPELLSVCATLSAKSPFVLPFGKEKEADAAKKSLGEGLQSDHLLFAKVSGDFMSMGYNMRNDWCYENYLSEKTLQMIETMRKDLRRYLDELKLGEDGVYSERAAAGDARKAELMAVLSSSLPLASRLPDERKFKCLEATSATCSLHPSSLLEDLSSPKRNRRGRWEEHQNEYTVLCWFSRMKTADLYLHDASIVADVLPLLLLSPSVKRREGFDSVFEVARAASAAAPDEERGVDEEDDDEGDGGKEALNLAQPARVVRLQGGRQKDDSRVKKVQPKPQRKVVDSWEDDDEAESEEAEEERDDEEEEEDEEEGWDSTHVPATSSRKRTAKTGRGRCNLLLEVIDKNLAGSLWELRELLQELVDIIIGEPPFQLPRDVGTAFAALRRLLLSSYRHHRRDEFACHAVTRGSATSTSASRGAARHVDDEEDIMASIAREQREARYEADNWGGGGWGSGKGKGRGGKGGKGGGGGGYPWWQHIRGGK
eukprot:TRINITY_DN9702_c0_g1_i1.p1 TRINITY_DN9702_c0_g1~~TRINITY_DN9702_c0_g1_i1.p1  ORF type:complete len:1254 (+),score=338.86 TRINITY_DN9702_c0_g1_i1:241-3762(+)